MVVVVTDVSQRLVDQMAQPSREILRAAADILEGGDLRSLVSEAERVSGVRTTCNKCVDPYFTGVYVDRLLTRSTRARAHEGLRDILATSNVTTTLVETNISYHRTLKLRSVGRHQILRMWPGRHIKSMHETLTKCFENLRYRDT